MKRINSYLYITGSEAEERYNVAQTATRNVDERTFVVWKRTFHVMHGEVWNKWNKIYDEIYCYNKIMLKCYAYAKHAQLIEIYNAHQK